MKQQRNKMQNISVVNPYANIEINIVEKGLEDLFYLILYFQLKPHDK